MPLQSDVIPDSRLLTLGLIHVLRHLLRFIKKKVKIEKDVPVLCRDGKVMTLSQVFEGLGITAYDLSVDMLDVHADRSMFHRFDRFNKKCGGMII